jgi:hypothetical protein
MQDDSSLNTDTNIVVGQDAYNKVVSSWNWIRRLAEEDKFNDDYILAISDTKTIGIMPVAEVLMCLVNTTEEDYKRLALPQPSSELIAKVTNKLLKTYETHKFSGVPYVRSVDPKLAPPFTDAVCYMAAALSSILKIKELDLKSDLKENCKDLLITCLDWLLQAAITADDKWENMECMKGVKGTGWSWSSPMEIAKDDELKIAFEKYLPPQTYFTSQVIITLQEIFYDHYDLVEGKGKVENTFQAIVNAKSFLLTSIISDTITGENGWGDYRYDETPGASNTTHMKPYALLSQETVQSLQDMSLYPLESLSYVRYYLSYQYTPVNDKIKKKFPKLYDEYELLSDKDLQNLNKVFQKSLAFLIDKKILEKPCSIQIPEPLNLGKGQAGFFKSQQEDQKSYYVDGTVAYNCINALSWYARFFTLDENIKNRWDKNKVKIVERILNNAFKKEGFVHSGSDKEGDPFVPSIYATRTAISSLLAWGVFAPGDSTQSFQNFTEVRELVRKLHHLVEPISQANTAEPSTLSFSKNEIEQLLDLPFIIGLTIPILKNEKKWQGNCQVLFNLNEIKEKLDIQTLLDINGKTFLKVLSTILTSSDKDQIKNVIGEFTKQIYLITPLKSFLIENVDKLAQLDFKGRIDTISSIPNLLLKTLEELGIDEKEVKDLYEPK